MELSLQQDEIFDKLSSQKNLSQSASKVTNHKTKKLTNIAKGNKQKSRLNLSDIQDKAQASQKTEVYKQRQATQQNISQQKKQKQMEGSRDEMYQFVASNLQKQHQIQSSGFDQNQAQTFPLSQKQFNKNKQQKLIQGQNENLSNSSQFQMEFQKANANTSKMNVFKHKILKNSNTKPIKLVDKSLVENLQKQSQKSNANIQVVQQNGNDKMSRIRIPNIKTNVDKQENNNKSLSNINILQIKSSKYLPSNDRYNEGSNSQKQQKLKSPLNNCGDKQLNRSFQLPEISQETKRQQQWKKSKMTNAANGSEDFDLQQQESLNEFQIRKQFNQSRDLNKSQIIAKPIYNLESQTNLNSLYKTSYNLNKSQDTFILNQQRSCQKIKAQLKANEAIGQQSLTPNQFFQDFQDNLKGGEQSLKISNLKDTFKMKFQTFQQEIELNQQRNQQEEFNDLQKSIQLCDQDSSEDLIPSFEFHDEVAFK